MKVVFVSNYFNHHQKTFSDCMDILTKGNYTFIQTAHMPEERRKLGYEQKMESKYIISTCNDETEKNRSKKLIFEADVVISGSAPHEYLKKRIKAGKLVFRYAERPLKKGNEISKYLPRLLRWNWWNPKNKPIYMLCSSAYTPIDYKKFGLFKNRTYKWGYFPEYRDYKDIDELINKKNKTSILWCGRLLDWKHPDDAIKAAILLKKDGYNFEFNIIGCGTMEEELSQIINKYGMSDCVNLLGAMSPEQVREHMEKSEIYLFTSDYQEGWGAVLNESMNSGCAVIASHAIGSVPYLIKDGYNGFVYESGNVGMLYEKMKYLIENSDKRRQLGKKAYDTIAEEWNASIAAERLINLTNHILAGEKIPDLYEKGPCSKAEIIKDNWFNESN